jgi:hypothetical protein
MKLLVAGNPSVVDELGCFRCGNGTADLNENGMRYIYCGLCRLAIRDEIVNAGLKREVDSMDWPEFIE